jgi:predicted transcriptional regulator
VVGPVRWNVSFNFLGSNLNNASFGRYLDVLLGASLLEERDRRYYTTEKGDSFLEFMAKIKKMISLDTLA